jgi:hypothetical protein
VNKGEGEDEGVGEFHRIDSKHHTTRFDYCLDSHHQVGLESRSLQSHSIDTLIRRELIHMEVKIDNQHEEF